MDKKSLERGIENLAAEFGEERVKKAVEAVKKFQVDVPSWTLGPFGGGRFGDYTSPGYARSIYEKLDDAAFIEKLTGAASMVATHILWDFSEDGMEGDYETARKVRDECRARGLSLGAVSPSFFLKGSDRGSFTSADAGTRKRYVEQTILGGKIAGELGNGILSLWFPDGSLYPGQVELKDSYEMMKKTLQESCSAIPGDVLLLIEYKVFEPNTYSTTIPDWGAAFLLAKSMGGNAGVLIDLGHHHPVANIEQIVAMLISEKMRSGFHFNISYAVDDDQAVEPNQQIARIFYELYRGGVVCGASSGNWAYMLDQASGKENRIHAIIHSIDALHLSLAKAAIVDVGKISEARRQDEVMVANRLFNDALINADVRPIVAKARLEKGLPLDPVDAYIKSGYQQKIEEERK